MMRAKVDAAQVADAVARMYMAALGQEDWTQALESLTRTGLGQNAHIFSIADGDSVPFQVAFNVSAEGMDSYARHYVRICPRIKYLAEHPGQAAYYDYQFTSDRAMARSEYYDWLRRYSLGPYFVGGVLHQEDGERYLLSMHRTRDTGHVQAPELRLFGVLQSHLSQALRIGRQFGESRGRAGSLEEMASHAAGATLLVSRGGRVLFANDAAARILQRAEGLILRDGRLHAVHVAEDALLSLALKSAAQIDAGKPASAAAVRVSTQSAHGYLVRIVPLAPFPLLRGAPEVRHIGVFVTPDCSRAAVSTALGLSPAETRVVLLLCDGLPLKRVASELQIAYNTARLHLAKAMRKTGTHRQLELLRLVQARSSR
jgi:DNA-binding CsgD family transcriptional regulator/PAS domain-containing protein